MNPSETAALGERLEAVRGRLAGAARIAGRKPEDVRLIAVSKLHPVEAILAAYGFGQRVFGENYVQEALAKQEALPDLDVEWHCIGHVQTNKAKDVTGRFALIHTVDNLKFAETLARRLPEDIPVQRVLLQVNIGNEPQKAGVDEHDLPALAEAVLALPRLEVRGLMCLPPFFDDGEAARPYFARLRELRDDLDRRLAAAGGQFGVTQAYTYAAGREVSVYDYTQIIFSTLIGFLVFDQLPDGWSFLGYALIIAAAVFIFLYNNGHLKLARPEDTL